MIRFCLILGFWIFTTACPNHNPIIQYDLVEHPTGAVRHDLIVVGYDNSKVRARGFTGSTPANSHVTLQVGEFHVDTTSDSKGRFDVILEANGHTATLTVENTPISYRIRDTVAAIHQIAQKPISVGNAPNDLLIVGDERFVVASMSGELQRISKSQQRTLHLAGNPWSVSSSVDNQYIAVSLQGGDEVVLVNKEKFVVTSKAKVKDARAPQGLLFDGNILRVAYTNLIKPAYQPGDVAQFGPGILAIFNIDGDQITYRDHIELPCQNPTQLIADWILCSGVFQISADKQTLLAKPAVLLRMQGTTIKQQIDLSTDFSPGTPAFSNDLIVVGNMLKPEILVINGDTKTLHRIADTGWFPFALARDGNLVWIADPIRDRIIVFDTLNQEWNPWPFVNGIPVAKQSLDGFFRGPQNMASQGVNVDVILGSSAQLVELQTLRLMGP